VTDPLSGEDQRTVKEIMNETAPVHSVTPPWLNDVVILVVSLALLAAIGFVFTR
jgi:hypothetical protein